MSSEKLVFTYEDSGEQVEFYILEQTKLNGNLMTDWGLRIREF